MDAAAASEAMVEKLTEKNLELEERNRRLTDVRNRRLMKRTDLKIDHPFL